MEALVTQWLMERQQLVDDKTCFYFLISEKDKKSLQERLKASYKKNTAKLRRCFQ